MESDRDNSDQNCRQMNFSAKIVLEDNVTTVFLLYTSDLWQNHMSYVHANCIVLIYINI